MEKHVGLARNRTGEAGYICIWGTSPKEKVTDPEGVIMECPECRQETRMIGKSVRSYCTLFYIPISPKGPGQDLFECSSCHSKFQGSTSELRQRIATRAQQLNDEIAQKAARYAEDRDDLANATDLITLYASAERQTEAVDLALDCLRRHPEHAGIRTLLGRLHLGQDRHTDALAAFREVIRSNPQHAGAHFYLAVTLCQGENPARDEALTHARQADSLGYPDARGLIQHIEQSR